MSFVSELRRRHVVKIGAAYLVVAWLLVQIVVNVEEPLHLPDYFDTAVVVLLALGFPIALIIAWAFDVTPDGIKLSRTGDSDRTIEPRGGRKLDYLIIGVLSLAVAFLLVDRYLLDARGGSDAVEDAAAAAGRERSAPAPGDAGSIPNSIAILPFDTLSDDTDDADFAEGVYADIFYELEKLDRLAVIGRRTMKRYEGTLKSYQEIAAETRTQTVLELLVRYANNRVRINAELVRIDGPADDVIWTDTYDEDYSSANLFDIQTDIARNIAERLVGELSPREETQISEVLTEDTEALSYYLRALKYTSDATLENAEHCLEPITEAVTRDPSFEEAWYYKGWCHDTRGIFFPEAFQEERRLSIAARERALSIDPEYADAHMGLAGTLALGGRWLEAGRAFRTALDLSDQLLGSTPLLFSTGYLTQARRDARRSFELDPENSVGANFLMLIHEVLGDSESADQVYRVGQDLYDAWPTGNHGRMLTLMGRIRQGRTDAGVLDRFFREEMLRAGLREEIVRRIETGEAVLPYLRRAARERADNPFAQMDIATFAAYFGDPELALEVMKTALSYNGLNMMFLWTPLFREVRRLDEFEDYMREIGLVDHWRAFGWPDMCTPFGDDDFSCT